MRKKEHKLLRTLSLAMAAALCACVVALGQQDGRFAQAQQENAKQLRQYSWKARTEIRKGSETKNIRLSLMRYGADGALQQTPLGGTPPPQLPTHGLRGLIAKRKKEDFMKTLDGLGALAKAYGHLAPGKMQHFMINAAFTPEVNPQRTLLRIQGRDVLQPGDSMTIWVDVVTRRQRRAEIQTTFEGNPVRIVSEFQDLRGGPTYMARSVVDYPDQGLTVITENFDYTRER